ncbi:MAG TPA: complex I subunit 5 family protein [Candidatus Sulfomarinibacteraceae bacterium]|nr:complex I subunit 5 family protein [Candidatus Sulfomarinibacteraceae bacterium]
MPYPAFVWLIAILLGAAPLVYLSGRLAHNRPFHRRSVARWAAVVAFGVAWSPYLYALSALNSQGTVTFTLGVVSLRADGLSILLAGLVLVLGTLVTLFSAPSMAGESGESKYYAMIVALSGVMIGLGCAGDLFNLWLWFEAMAVSSYLLVAFYRDESASLEAGFKYLVQSAIGSVLVLLAIALVLAETGTLDLLEIHEATATMPGLSFLLAAGALFVVGFGVKVALVPLHTWLPDAHAQAPSGVSALLSGVVIEAGLVALLRALGSIAAVIGGGQGPLDWGILLLSFGLLNMIAGNLLALRQTQVKRMLAYSSLTHMGYMLVGIGVALHAGQVAGAEGGLFHLLSHGLMKGLAFLAAGALLYVLHSALGDHGPLTIAELGGAAQRYPLLALALSVALLGLGGLPPFVGFMSKWQILVAGVATQELWIVGVVIFAALNSVFSLAYYAPVVNVMYRSKTSPVVQAGASAPALLQAPLVLLIVGTVAGGVWPALVQGLTGPAATALLTAFSG